MALICCGAGKNAVITAMGEICCPDCDTLLATPLLQEA